MRTFWFGAALLFMRRRRPALTLAVAASLTGGGAAPALAAAPATEIRVGQASDFTRIEFRGAQPIGVSRDGEALVLRFGRIAPPDLRRLRITPPRFLKGAEVATTSSGVDVRLLLADRVSAKLGRADGGAYVNLSAPADGPPPEVAAPHPAAPSTVAATETAPAGAVPASVRMRAALNGRTLTLSFPFGAPVGAAVFRRGEAIWLVFDAKTRIDLTDAPRGLAQVKSVETIDAPAASVLRLIAPRGVSATASWEAGTWTVALAGGPPPAGRPVAVVSGADGALTTALGGATGVHWLRDPAVGDRIAVVTARTPAALGSSPRTLVEATLLASAQGLAVQPSADDLTVTASGDQVRIARPHGLATTSADAALQSHGASTQAAGAGHDAAEHGPERNEPAADTADLTALPNPPSMPGLVEFDAWAKTGRGGFLQRYDALKALAAEEAGQGPGAPTDARIGLARFLVGSELAHEAIGVLALVAKADPKSVDTPAFRGLRGAARAIAGRATEAELDLASAALVGDPASALWRGYMLTKAEDWNGARAAFTAGASAKSAFNTRWRARFARAEADAALALNDLEGARAVLAAAPGSGVDPLDMQGLTLAQARLAQASGQANEALRLYQSVETSAYGAVSAPAAMHAVELRLAAHAIPFPEALKTLDSLRYRWRGDGTELQVVRSLSTLYLGQGRYREALEAMRSAGRRLPDLPEANAITADLTGAFRALFLDGLADALQPIQALALFDDYRELTPIGADGDRMVRRLTKRLVDVDLLDQAAALLKYQVENRLDGVPKAEVSTDLASVYLMARQPEQALQAINGSRSTLLPGALNAERRAIEGRALLGLGRYDHALELIGDDRTPEALEVKADAAWAKQSWAQAGASLEAGLGDRWRDTARPLTPAEEQRLLRAGIAYSLARDERALARIRARWGRLASAGRSPDAMRVALTGASGPALTPADLSRAATETDAFAGWVSRAKARFLVKDGAPSAAAPVAAAPSTLRGRV